MKPSRQAKCEEIVQETIETLADESNRHRFLGLRALVIGGLVVL
jgi:hypothetical protein